MFDYTHSDLYGEQRGIFHDLENVGPYELATMSFGQRFNITPLQLITALSCVANEGVLMKPNIIKEIRNPNNGSVTKIKPERVRQVISKQTAETLMDMSEYVVTNGTGASAKVSGYTVGGKSGTTEPLKGSNTGYIASFVGFAPVENTDVVVLVILYNPKGGFHQGGQVARTCSFKNIK